MNARQRLRAGFLGKVLQQLREGGEVLDQLVLPLIGAVEVVADADHQVGQRPDALLQVLDGGVALGPGAEERAADCDRAAAGVRVIVCTVSALWNFASNSFRRWGSVCSTSSGASLTLYRPKKTNLR